MIFLAKNLRVLRKDQHLSQQVLADKLHISRASLAKYEGGVNEPSLEVLIRISRYFRISIDLLLTTELDQKKLAQLIGTDATGGMILPIQVNAEGENVIEIVPHSAQAGYTGHYSDPGFIESLDQMALPFQELHGKCRAFPIEGDSMPPFGDGSFVVGRQILSHNEIRDGKRYIFLSRDEGIVFKRAYESKSKNGILSLHSDNPKYKPFQIALHEIVEIWEFVAAISFQSASENYFANDVLSRVKELQEEVQKLAFDLSS